MASARLGAGLMAWPAGEGWRLPPPGSEACRAWQCGDGGRRRQRRRRRRARRGELAEIAGDLVDQAPDPGDLFVRWQGFGPGPVVQAGGGQGAFPVAQQVIEVGAQVREVGDVGAEVVAAGAPEPVGQAWPPALTLEGSAQIPNGTATSPTRRRTCSESSRAWAVRQVRLPWRSNCIAATRSTASRRRASPTV